MASSRNSRRKRKQQRKRLSDEDLCFSRAEASVAKDMAPLLASMRRERVFCAHEELRLEFYALKIKRFSAFFGIFFLNSMFLFVGLAKPGAYDNYILTSVFLCLTCLVCVFFAAKLWHINYSGGRGQVDDVFAGIKELEEKGSLISQQSGKGLMLCVVMASASIFFGSVAPWQMVVTMCVVASTLVWISSDFKLAVA